MSREISCQELRDKISAGEELTFFDVREEWEHEEANIGAKSMPLPSIPNRLNELEHLKEQEIIVHCKTGSRGNQACKFLSSKGFTNVRNLSGGIEAYLKEA